VKLKPFTPQKFRRRVFGQVWMLALQFVLGMILNLVSQDAARHVYQTVLVAHIVNAVGLLEGALFIALKEGSKLSWWAAVAIFATFGSGALTVVTKQDAWSFVMACGFIVSIWLYGMLYVRADRKLESASKQ
jgi:hypothetical protein